MLSFKEIEMACKGHYVLLARSMAPFLEPALSKLGQHVPDPFRSGSKDGFRLFPDFNETGMGIFNAGGGVHFTQLCMRFSGASYAEIMKRCASVLGLEQSGNQKGSARLNASAEFKAQSEVAAVPQIDYAKRQRALHKQERYLLPLTDPAAKPVWDYLVSRGLGSLRYDSSDALSRLRVNTRCTYFNADGKKEGSFPALFAPVFDEHGQLWSWHRTYLKDGRKAPVGEAKKLMSPGFRAEGSLHIELGSEPEHGILGIAEGIETALSAHLACGLPVWSAVNAGFLSRFTPPAGVKAVVIFADKDASQTGQNAARELAERLNSSGIVAKIALPKEDLENRHGVDWNDVLLSKGVCGFPNPLQLFSYMQSEIAKHARKAQSEPEERKPIRVDFKHAS